MEPSSCENETVVLKRNNSEHKYKIKEVPPDTYCFFAKGKHTL